MPNWFSDWERLKERLRAQQHALSAIALSAQVDPNSSGFLLTMARAEQQDLAAEVEGFLAAHGGAIPPRARDALASLLQGRKVLTDISGAAGAGSAGALLAAKLASADYYFADREARGRTLIERAFLHLDRLIVADDEVRARWQEALQDGEPACERIGGVHLLQHGIWAFKAHAIGERTDLVLGTPMTEADVDRAGRAAELMVLTEWKVLTTAEEVEAKRAEADTQLRLYAAGSLAGFELQATRYAITVGDQRIDALAPITENGVTYRHIHVAVDPPTPSVVSRQRSARSK